ncbi:hypothetical protein [Paenibacillus sp. GYB003]|uniref:hypothetical protein n=1 Tax=Paenibacillus sp. GYB003 TaxID=2994392 RepID=UPI002F96E859
MLEVNNPEYTVLNYDPRWGELRVSAEPSVYYMAEGGSFCVDMNPLGDRALAEIDGFSIDPKAGEIRFRARWKGALEEFLVTSDRDADRQIFGFIADRPSLDPVPRLRRYASPGIPAQSGSRSDSSAIGEARCWRNWVGKKVKCCRFGYVMICIRWRKCALQRGGPHPTGRTRAELDWDPEKNKRMLPKGPWTCWAH